MIRHYIKIAFRNLIKYKSQSVISIVGLAIGFTAMVLGGYWWWWENHFDNFHPEKDRLYALTTTGYVKKATGADADLNQLHRNDLEEIKKLLPEIEDICLLSTDRRSIKHDNTTQTVFGVVGNSNFFSLFYADFIVGTYKGIVADGTSVILTESLARSLYGTVECIGEVFETEDGNQRVVAGVIKDYPENTDFILQYVIINEPSYSRINRLPTYIRLHKGSNVKQVKQKLAAYKSHADDPRGSMDVGNWKISLRTPEEVHLYCHPELTDRFRNIKLLSVAGLMAFLSALMNILVLFIGMQQKKLQKNKTYTYIGGSFKSILYKSWTELILPVSIAYIAGFCLLEVIFPYYKNYTTWNLYGIYEGISRQINRSQLYTNGFFIMLASTPVLLFLSYLPVRHIFRSKEMQIIHYKRGLITGQIFTGSLFFLISIVLFRQLDYTLHVDRGLDYDHVIQINMGFNSAYQKDIRVLKPALQNHPYAEKVCYTAVNTNIFTEQGDWYGTFVSTLAFDPLNYDPTKENSFLVVDEDFFSLFQLRLIDGSFPDERNINDLVTNETGYKQSGYPDLLERSLYNPDSQASLNSKVSGIIKDYIYAPLQYPAIPVFFTLYSDEKQKMFPAQYFYVRYTPGYKKEVVRHIQNTIKELDTDEVPTNKKIVELTTIIEDFNRPERIIFSLFGILAVMCILISTFGIYSLVSLSTEQRKKEIAIRKVNGATFRNILQIFVREYLILTLIGNIFALSIGYILMKRWLETYSYHIHLSVWFFIMVFFITSVIVILSIYYQVKQAASENPIEAIKTE